MSNYFCSRYNDPFHLKKLPHLNIPTANSRSGHTNSGGYLDPKSSGETARLTDVRGDSCNNIMDCLIEFLVREGSQ